MSIALAAGNTTRHDHMTGKLQFLQVTANRFQIKISFNANNYKTHPQPEGLKMLEKGFLSICPA
jgi:hypothetical protein